MRTLTPNNEQIDKKWYLVDARNQVLGRLSSKIATIIRGKNKPYYTPHLDTGDNVIVINAKHVKVTGRKASQKTYQRYSGYHSGLKSHNLAYIREQNPEYIIWHSVWGMLPHNKLGRKLIKKLFVYSGNEHPHQAQEPEVLEL
ncbi:50S ribosomal protein L13 [bacterium]|nr:50S ribosomal protein L13 [bacterium]